MTARRFVTRRAVLTDVGKAGMAIMVFGAAACGPGEGGDTTAGPNTTSGPGTTDPTPTTSPLGSTTTPAPGTTR